MKLPEKYVHQYQALVKHYIGRDITYGQAERELKDLMMLIRLFMENEVEYVLYG